MNVTIHINTTHVKVCLFVGLIVGIHRHVSGWDTGVEHGALLVAGKGTKTEQVDRGHCRLS